MSRSRNSGAAFSSLIFPRLRANHSFAIVRRKRPRFQSIHAIHLLDCAQLRAMRFIPQKTPWQPRMLDAVNVPLVRVMPAS
jgi:hypothetical protein